MKVHRHRHSYCHRHHQNNEIRSSWRHAIIIYYQQAEKVQQQAEKELSQLEMYAQSNDRPTLK
jgi:hypothetical protein